VTDVDTEDTTPFPWSPGPGGTPPPRFAQLRECDALARVALADGTPIWLVTRYEDVVMVLTDPVFSRYQAATMPGAGLGRSQGNSIVDLDGPAHTRFRGPTVAAFDVARVMRWRGRIETIAAEALDVLATLAAPAGDEPAVDAGVDLVAGYTEPLAGRVICELLGVSGEGWRRLTADVETQVMAASLPVEQGAQARERITATLTQLLRRAREHPGDDVASTLLSTAGGPDLSDAERLTLMQGLVMSGFIGVRDLLARHLFAVLADPGLAARLRDDPAAVPAAVEALLRYYPSSNDGLLRMATEDVVLGGVELPAGTPVLPLISAAFRDPRHFPGPDRADVDRPDAGYERNVAFGAGPHACPAADLARTELRIGLSALLSRFPDVRLAVPATSVRHSSDLIPLGIPELPVVLTQATGAEPGEGPSNDPVENVRPTMSAPAPTSSPLDPGLVKELAAEVEGPVLLPGEGGYDDERAGFELTVDQHPAVVVGAVSAQDVVAAVVWAAAQGLPVAVQATGHGASSPADGVVYVSTKRMQDMTVDSEAKTATFGAGVRWEKVIAAAAKHGLAPLSGSAPFVGATSYTLGGGLGLMSRTYGLASDSVVEFDLVTADGRLLRVLPESEPDLFWGVRGSKGNLGIVTSLTVRLYPVPLLYGGSFFIDGEHLRSALATWLDWTAGMDEWTATSVFMVQFPDAEGLPPALTGYFVLTIRLSYVGPDLESGRRSFAELREALPPLLDGEVADLTYIGAGKIHNDPPAPVASQSRTVRLKAPDAKAASPVEAAPRPPPVSRHGHADERTAPPGLRAPLAKGEGGLWRPTGPPKALGRRKSAATWQGDHDQ